MSAAAPRYLTIGRWGHAATRRACAALLVLLAGPVMANGERNWAEVYAQAASRFDENFSERWAFTERRDTGEAIHIGRYDPAAVQPWQLISLDGRAPAARESEEYLEEKARQARGEGRGGQQRDVADLARPESLRLIEQTPTHWLLGFVPAGDGDDEAIMSRLQGRMLVNRAGPWIEYIDIHNEDSFKPRFGVRIREFAMRFDFSPLDDGPVLPTSMRFRIDMKAMGLMTINREVNASYSAYEAVIAGD